MLRCQKSENTCGTLTFECTDDTKHQGFRVLGFFCKAPMDCEKESDAKELNTCCLTSVTLVGLWVKVDKQEKSAQKVG